MQNTHSLYAILTCFKDQETSPVEAIFNNDNHAAIPCLGQTSVNLYTLFSSTSPFRPYNAPINLKLAVGGGGRRQGMGWGFDCYCWPWGVSFD